MGTVIMLTLWHSGAQYNPAVTFILWLRKKMDIVECLMNIVA